MAFSVRNLFGVGGAKKLSAREAALNVRDGALYGAQPMGVLGGEYIHIPSNYLINDLGTRWIKTIIDGGSDAAEVMAIQPATATEGPFVTLTTNDAASDACQLQYAAPQTASTTSAGASTAYAPFIAKAGYNINFEFKFRITSTVANAMVLFGLAEVDTSLTASHVISTASLIGFYKAGSATMGGIVRAGSTSTTVAVTSGGSAFTPTINTWYTVGFRQIGRTACVFSIGNEKTGTTTMTNLPANTVLLTPSIAISAVGAAVASMDIKGAYWGQEAH